MLRGSVLALAGVAFLCSPFTENAALQSVAVVTLALIAGLLLRPQFPPVLAFALGYQWLQVATGALYANWLGLPMTQLFPKGDAALATYYGLGSLSTAAVALAIGLRHMRLDRDSLQRSLQAIPVGWAARTYLLMALVSYLLAGWAGVGGRASQAVDGIVGLKWATYFLLLACALVQRRGGLVAAAAVIAEVLIGTAGYFANFSVPLFFALLAFAATFSMLSRSQRSLAVVLALCMLSMGVVWNTLKNEYRREVSGNSGEQAVVVDLGEQYGTLGRLAGESVRGGVDEALDKFAMRLAYVEYFGYVIDRVPAELPHLNGELLLTAIEHILVPRLLFPNKPPLPSDSEMTAFYTANPYLLLRTSTSISLGYVTESYIDFGVFGIPLAGLILALLMGAVTLGFHRFAPTPAVGMALSCAVLLNARLFETSLPKLLGGVIASSIVSMFVLLAIARWLPIRRRAQARGLA